MRAPTRPRNASPMSRFFPEMRNGMILPPLLFAGPCQDVRAAPAGVNATNGSWFCAISRRGAGRRMFFTAALHRGRYPHCLAIFRDSAPRDVDSRLAQLLHDGIVGQDLLRALGLDQMLDAVTHGLGRVRLAAVRRRARG